MVISMSLNTYARNLFMPKICYHIPPEEGWEQLSYYVVEISKGKGNPIFEGILYTGFLDNTTGCPLGYSGVFNPLMEPEFMEPKRFPYIKAIRKIDMSIPNKHKDITGVNTFEMKINERIIE